MEYETYETYETAYETDAAYDDIYAGDSKAKVAETWIWFDFVKYFDQAKNSPTGKENLKEGDAKKTNLVNLVFLDKAIRQKSATTLAEKLHFWHLGFVNVCV